MVLSSRMEGGANVIGEAAVAGVPILASRIEGSIGLLGARHPGFFDVGDTHALRDLMLRSESERGFYRELKRASREAAGLFRPERERRAWRALISELQL
jgi:glycosyltransferase involved in cell wall biosynthesis